MQYFIYGFKVSTHVILLSGYYITRNSWYIVRRDQSVEDGD